MSPQAHDDGQPLAPQGAEELRGRYGTVRLAAGVPPDLAGRILALLNGEGSERSAQARSELPGGEETVEVPMRVLAARTADGTDEDDLEEIQTAPETMTWSEEDEARASAEETGAWTQPGGPGLGVSAVPPQPEFPEPEPGSGRRRRRGHRSEPAGPAESAASGQEAGGAETIAPSHPMTAPVVVKMRMDASTQRFRRQADAAQDGQAPAGEEGTASRPVEEVVLGAAAHAMPAVPIVWAAMCASGHVNPPDVMACLSCPAPLTGQHCQVPLPVLATLNVSTGFIVPVRGEVVIGRAPQPRVGGPATTILVPVPSPGSVISRSHLLVSTAGWSILVQDLGSHNGTVLVRSGGPPVLLAPSMPTPLYVGDLLDIGDGATIRVDPPTPTP